jgi:hypothetical protein
MAGAAEKGVEKWLVSFVLRKSLVVAILGVLSVALHDTVVALGLTAVCLALSAYLLRRQRVQSPQTTTACRLAGCATTVNLALLLAEAAAHTPDASLRNTASVAILLTVTPSVLYALYAVIGVSLPVFSLRPPWLRWASAASVAVLPIHAAADNQDVPTQFAVKIKPRAKAGAPSNDQEDAWEILSTTSRGSEDIWRPVVGAITKFAPGAGWGIRNRKEPGIAATSSGKYAAEQDVEAGPTPRLCPSPRLCHSPDRPIIEHHRVNPHTPATGESRGWGKWHRYRNRERRRHLAAQENVRRLVEQSVLPLTGKTLPRKRLKRFKIRWNKPKRVVVPV